MPKLSPIGAKELIIILEKQGFIKIRQKRSHVRWNILMEEKLPFQRILVRTLG